MKTKRPRGTVANAVHVAKVATGEIQEGPETHRSVILTCKKPKRDLPSQGESSSAKDPDPDP